MLFVRWFRPDLFVHLSLVADTWECTAMGGEQASMRAGRHGVCWGLVLPGGMGVRGLPWHVGATFASGGGCMLQWRRAALAVCCHAAAVTAPPVIVDKEEGHG